MEIDVEPVFTNVDADVDFWLRASFGRFLTLHTGTASSHLFRTSRRTDGPSSSTVPSQGAYGPAVDVGGLQRFLQRQLEFFGKIRARENMQGVALSSALLLATRSFVSVSVRHECTASGTTRREAPDGATPHPSPLRRDTFPRKGGRGSAPMTASAVETSAAAAAFRLAAVLGLRVDGRVPLSSRPARARLDLGDRRLLFLGIVLGVAALIVVMAVMNGFRLDLMDKIIGLNGHIFLQGVETPLTDYAAVTDRV